MICPKCSAETKVIDSRPIEEGRMIRRRRVCEGCAHRFASYESTRNVAREWRLDQRAAGDRYRRWAERATPEERAARWKRKRLRASARAEAAETGEPIADVMARYGVPEPKSHPVAQR